MTPWLQDADVTLYHGDALTVLRELLPDESVHCIATSPPFYALRDYGVDGQIGLEETPDAWAAALVDVFREARRVLRKDGTLWVECGDSYVSGQGGRQSAVGELPPTTRFDRKEAGKAREGLPTSFGERDVGPRFYPTRETRLKPKDLLGTPWLLAFALRADGWWLRGCNIWAKPNAMPESAKDRCTTAHSYVFQLSKSARYFFDGDAISEAFSENTHGKSDNSTPKSREHEDGKAKVRQNASFADSIPLSLAPSAQRRVPQVETLDGLPGESSRGPDGRLVTHVEQGENSLQHRNGERWPNEQRHPRSVWTIPTQPYSFRHFATWPEALARKIISAGCPPDGVVLDPFVGSGTTCLVARKLGRHAVGIDLSEEYLKLAARRLQQQSLFAEVAS